MRKINYIDSAISMAMNFIVILNYIFKFIAFIVFGIVSSVRFLLIRKYKQEEIVLIIAILFCLFNLVRFYLIAFP